MDNVIESYLVKLGFSIDRPELDKFKGALKEAGTAAEQHTSGIIQQFVKWQSAIAGAFAAVGLSTVAMMSKVADADLSYQKMGLSMGMTTKSARELAIAQKALGISIADANWNLEQRARLRKMISMEDRYLEPGLPADFGTTMEHIRSISNEFKYMQGILVYISMELTDKLYKALGGDSFLAKLQHFTEWFAIHSKDISDWLARVLVPILKDAEHVMQDVWKVAMKLAEAFVRIVGAISGDDSLRQGAVNMDTLGRAIDKAADYMVQFVDAMTSAELVLLDMVETLADVVRGLYDASRGDFKKAGQDFRRAGHDGKNAGGDLTGGGAAILGIAGAASLIGARTVWGLVRGVGSAARAGAGGVIEGAGAAGALGTAGSILSILGLAELAQYLSRNDDLSSKTFAGRELAWENKFPLLRWLNGLGGMGGGAGTDLNALASAVAWRESGNHQIDPKTGKVILGPMTRSGQRAIGVMQLMPGTAAALGVDPYDETQNRAGGLRYLGMMLQKYGGNIQEALAANNWGPGNLDAAIKRHGGQFSLDYLPADTRNYIRDIQGHMGGGGVTVNFGGVTIGSNVTQQHLSQLKNVTKDAVEEALNDRSRRQLVNAQARGAY